MLSDTYTLNKITVMFRSIIRVQVWCDNTRVVLCLVECSFDRFRSFLSGMTSLEVHEESSWGRGRNAIRGPRGHDLACTVDCELRWHIFREFIRTTSWRLLTRFLTAGGCVLCRTVRESDVFTCSIPVPPRVY